MKHLFLYIPGQITLTINDCLDATFSQMQLEYKNIKYLLQSADMWTDALWKASEGPNLVNRVRNAT